MSGRFLNIYEGGGVTILHLTRREADLAAKGAARIACVELIWPHAAPISVHTHCDVTKKEEPNGEDRSRTAESAHVSSGPKKRVSKAARGVG